MLKLVPQEKIFNFLSTEFSRIKNEHLQQRASRKYKSKTVEKKVGKLLNDIELILKTSNFENHTRTKIIDLKKEVKGYFQPL